MSHEQARSHRGQNDQPKEHSDRPALLDGRSGVASCDIRGWRSRQERDQPSCYRCAIRWGEGIAEDTREKQRQSPGRAFGWHT